jgi:SulP family sulfate permease
MGMEIGSSTGNSSSTQSVGHFLGWLLKPFSPPIRTIKHYNLHKLRKDLIAGLTVSVVEIPQSMAYAIIAGVPPQYGLYSSVIQGVIGALLSSSEHMTTGPTNTQALLVASAVHRLADPTGNPATYLQLVFALTLLKGLIQLSFAAAGLGSLVRYVSRSVIAGLVSGAGVLIICGQLPAFLGIEGRAESPLPGILRPLTQVAHQISQINLHAVIAGVCVVAIVAGLRAVSRLLPGALVAIVFVAGLSTAVGWSIPRIDAIPHVLPHFQIPSLGWLHIEQLIGGATALAVIGLLESVAIAKSIALRTGADINPNQECFSQGFKNTVSSFFQCIPGSGSFTRTALDYAAGAQTRFAAVYSAIFVAIIVWVFAEWAHMIPKAALAGLLFVIAMGLIEWKYVPRVIKSNRPDALVYLMTFTATLLLPLEFAIFVGIFLNIALYLRQASRLHLREIVETSAGGPFQEKELSDRSGTRQVVFLQMEGDLFFGVADELRDRLSPMLRPDSNAKVVIFRLRRTHSVDSTVLHVLEQFTRDMQQRGRHVILCGVRPELMPVLRNFGLQQLIGPENVFETTFGVYTSAKEAFARARHFVGSSIDTHSIDAGMEDEAWAYEI